MSQEYIAFLEAEVTKVQTGRCPNCSTVLRPIHCCVCEGCDGCVENRTTELEQAARAALQWFDNEPGMPKNSAVVTQLRAALHPQPEETK